MDEPPEAADAPQPSLAVAAVEPVPPEPVVVVPSVPTPLANLDEVTWTSSKRHRAGELAALWGFRLESLQALNPELERGDWVDPDTPLVVFRTDASKPTQSLGAPNRGRLRSGLPMPEGPFWRLRNLRHRTYGARYTIEGLIQAFHSYGSEHPDAEPIRIGEISKRNGGKILPHASHRTGRDVDIGYVLKNFPEDRQWRYATPKNFDAERNWAFIKALIATGRVQRIFIGTKLQRPLMKVAREELTPDEMAATFQAANKNPYKTTVIKAWKGHRDHMHVRFKCAPGNNRCAAKSRDRKKRRRKKSA